MVRVRGQQQREGQGRRGEGEDGPVELEAPVDLDAIDDFPGALDDEIALREEQPGSGVVALGRAVRQPPLVQPEHREPRITGVLDRDELAAMGVGPIGRIATPDRKIHLTYIPHTEMVPKIAQANPQLASATRKVSATCSAHWW